VERLLAHRPYESSWIGRTSTLPIFAEGVVSPSDAGRTVTRGARVPPYLDRRPLYSLTVK